MDIDKKEHYNVGDVIYAINYNMKYDCKQPISKDNLPYVKNFFLVVYTEAQDSLTLHRRNCQALKLTTRLVDEQLYACAIDNSKNPYLQSDGYVCCSKLHTFDTRQIIGAIGQMDQATMKRVFKIYHRFQCELERQFIERI